MTHPFTCAVHNRQRAHAVLGLVILTLLALAILAGGAPRQGQVFDASIRHTSAPTDPQWRLVARDEFNGGRLDTSKWATYSGVPGCCKDAQWDGSRVQVANGRLRLKNYPDENGRWLSGGVGGWGWDEANRTYGRVDARIKFDKGEGVSAAALLWPKGNEWPPEVDFYEIFSSWTERDKMMVTTHWKPFLEGAAGARSGHELAQATVSADFSQWHVTSVEWGPDRLEYYLDGRLVKLETGPEIVPSRDMWIGLQTHAHRLPSGNMATLAAGDPSVTLRVDWVRVYDETS